MCVYSDTDLNLSYSKQLNEKEDQKVDKVTY